MDTNIVPEPTPTPTSTSTPWPTNTWRPTDTPKRPTNTPQPPTPTFTWYPSATFTRVSQNPSPSFTPTNTTQPPTPTPTPFIPTFTRTNAPQPTPTQTYYSVMLYVNPQNGGEVSGGGSYQAGTLVTISASPKRGWKFSGWSGGYNGTGNPYSFVVTGDVIITANFISQ